MTKRPLKRGQRRRRQSTFLLLVSIILLLIVGPFAWRMERLRQAENAYDVPKVKAELQWLEVHGGFLTKLGLIKDATLWLELNIGSTDLESKLAVYHDEKHQFWLLLLDMQAGKMTEAQKVIGELGNTPAGELGRGLLSLVKGNAEESRRLLTKTDVGWETLSRHEQTLRHLTLAQASMILGDHPSTQSEFQVAQSLEPQNPACLSMEMDIAIEEGQWTKALELSNTIDSQTWRPKTTLFETKRAVLAIREDNLQKLTDTLSTLKELPRGEATIYYVNGIQALHKGQLQEGKNLLERALKSGLDAGVEADVQKALEQVAERQKADKVLQSVVAKT
ncbi:tetratricopeptide repeat protein [Desulfosporosinus metallidurans]|uniref:Tetratricopeptide repeat protein n=1 Tax=Desulfosporosinus metallidurans TaxID=1888891 RepID=A0A1Q8R2B4_9FIRM|nr:hypothetical protein [Desulfosporosinus metallidurans]OLN33698.1 hypothetical protein DSOL_0408 [Desulfosporosinus metallidurans]